MAADIETVKNTLSEYVKAVKSAFPVEKAFLYGSYAKGTQNEHSDVDICFILSTFAGKRSVDIVTKLLTIAGKYGAINIEPRAFPASELANGNPFINEVVKTGKEIV